MKKIAKKKISKKSVKQDTAIYRLYDPVSGRYISGFGFNSWNSNKPKIIFSNAAKSFLLSSGDLARFYKKVYELKCRCDGLVTKLKMHSLSNEKLPYGYSKKDLETEIEKTQAFLKEINSLKLQQFSLVKDTNKEKLSKFKAQGVNKLSKSVLREQLRGNYDWNITDWILKNFNKKEKPYALVLIDNYEYNYDKRQKIKDSYSEKFKELGLGVKWSNVYSNCLIVSTKEDLLLLQLSIDSSAIDKKVLVSDLVDQYKNIINGIETFTKDKW